MTKGKHKFISISLIILMAVILTAITACIKDNDIDKQELFFYDFPITVKYHIMYSQVKQSLLAEEYWIPVFSNLNLCEENDPKTNNYTKLNPPYIVEGVGKNAEAIAISHQKNPACILVYEESDIKCYHTGFSVKFNLTDRFTHNMWGDSAEITALKIWARGEIHEVKVDITIDFVDLPQELNDIAVGGVCVISGYDPEESFGLAQIYIKNPGGNVSSLAFERIYVDKPEYTDVLTGISELKIYNIFGGALLTEYFNLDINDIKHDGAPIIAQQERRINITFSLNTDIEYRHYIEVIPLYADIRIYPQDKTITVPIGYFEIHSERSTSLIPSDYHKKEGFYTGYTE